MQHDIKCDCIDCLIELFRSRIGNLGATKEHALYQCFTFNMRFVRYVRMWGRDDCRIVELISRIHSPGESNHPSICHYVAWFERDRLSVDWTIRQFVPDAVHPMVLGEPQLRIFWEEINFGYQPATEAEARAVQEIARIIKESDGKETSLGRQGLGEAGQQPPGQAVGAAGGGDSGAIPAEGRCGDGTNRVSPAGV